LLIEGLGVIVEQVGDVLLGSHHRRCFGAERGQRQVDLSGIGGAAFERPAIGDDRSSVRMSHHSQWPASR